MYLTLSNSLHHIRLRTSPIHHWDKVATSLPSHRTKRSSLPLTSLPPSGENDGNEEEFPFLLSIILPCTTSPPFPPFLFPIDLLISHDDAKERVKSGHCRWAVDEPTQKPIL